MEIEFYEEFPTKKNLEKLNLIKFQTKIFVAAKSITEFQKLENQIKKIKSNCIVAYWPIIKNSYWISPFSNTKDLKELFRELDNIKNPLLIDLELPFKNKFMIIKNLFSFLKNKRMIKKFLQKNKKRITSAQYPRSVISKLMKFSGLNYSIAYEKNPMFYTSMFKQDFIKKVKKYLSNIKDKENYAIGLGTIATGIQGNEPILPPETLEKDLNFIKEVGFNKAIIFRLGGLNKKYIKVLNKEK